MTRTVVSFTRKLSNMASAVLRKIHALLVLTRSLVMGQFLRYFKHCFEASIGWFLLYRSDPIKPAWNWSAGVGRAGQAGNVGTCRNVVTCVCI